MTAAPSVRGELGEDSENFVQVRDPDWPVHLQLCCWCPKTKGFIMRLFKATGRVPSSPLLTQPVLPGPIAAGKSAWHGEENVFPGGSSSLWSPGCSEVAPVWVCSPVSPRPSSLHSGLEEELAQVRL